MLANCLEMVSTKTEFFGGVFWTDECTDIRMCHYDYLHLEWRWFGPLSLVTGSRLDVETQ